MKQAISTYVGITILAILLVSTFIKIPVESGTNYSTVSPLLGILIFYSPIILISYIVIAVFLIIKGLKGKIRFV